VFEGFHLKPEAELAVFDALAKRRMKARLARAFVLRVLQS
ncbi:hypothetical protein A2U01_0066996, partial [Trifolium medium]|nr:hypothetical protein [Trifolium medium]